MAEQGYNDTTVMNSREPVHPDQHQKSLHGTLQDVQAELERVERRLRELRLIERSCTSALEVFEQDVASKDSDSGRGW